MGGQKVQMQKVASSTGAVAQTQQQGQCVQVSQAMIGTQPTAQIISPIQVRLFTKRGSISKVEMFRKSSN